MPNAAPHLPTTTPEDRAALDVALDRLGADRQPELAYDAHGNVCGLVHYDEHAGRWYAVDREAALLLARMPAEGGELYERWCDTTEPVGEGASRDAALLVAGAFTSSAWCVSGQR